MVRLSSLCRSRRDQRHCGTDTWIAQYYYTYAILLAQSDRCNEALPLTQTI